MNNLYADSLWIVLQTMPVPSFIFKQGKLILSESELAVYVYLCHLASKPHSNCTIQASVPELEKATGYAEAQVKRALAGLREKKFIGQTELEARDVTGQFATSDYVMCDPTKKGRSMAQTPAEDRRKDSSLRSALFHDQQSYLTAPEHIAELLDRLKGTPLAAYIAVLQLANLLGEREFEVAVKEWRNLADIARNETLFSATEKLSDESVLDSIQSDSGRNVKVYLKNPETGRDLSDEIAESDLKQEAEGQRSDERPYSRDQLLTWAASVFTVPVTGASNDELITFCRCGGNPKRKLRPTLCMNGDKGKYGVYYCHHCEDAGTLLQLVMKQGRMGLIEALSRLEGRSQ